ncbi:efflux RND transporter periplasmic adaptor subunit [Xanthovirga aplysinae]|uniref:efflux RND transporter periplasmic adaptor subunit n=1 Tax=Xanthovirga aplysinae TaxID=2529853 RepID=UPI0012BB5D31|nr:efflux RND transporter periplasmic adaptor subunit [Xanthovirga aplysinae]MTI32394.1 efflux RND transporter periplasmic adaptor subunit [Xanthovirga aplysinae]
MKALINIKKLRPILFVLLGLLAGWLIFGGNGSTDHNKEQTNNEMDQSEDQNTLWTCSMHPQIRQHEPGQCPICGMDLIPVQSNAGQENPNELQMSESAIAMANIQTSEVMRGKAQKEILLNGKVVVDERRFANEIAHVPGRVEKLYINFTGEKVRKGQKIADVYSPELIVAQEELLEALKTKEKYPQLLEAARNKLRNWKISDQQITAIENSGKVQNLFEIHAGNSGYVTQKRVNLGDHLQEGTIMYDIADLSKVWVMFDAYESDLAFLEAGDKVKFTVSSLPGRTFEASITYIDPVVNPETRTVSIRTEVSNKEQLLKPDMFARAKISADLGSGDIDQLIIPKSAVLWTGTRSVVYVQLKDREEPTFQLRQVILGQSLGDTYIIKEGLNNGESVVTNGAFSVDAAAQLKGLPSMMSQPNADEPTKQEITKAEGVNPKFQKQLNEVLKAYYQLTDVFFNHNPKDIQKQALQVKNALEKTDMKLVQDQYMKDWMEQFEGMQENLKNMQASNELDIQKKELDLLSQTLLHSVKEFGVEETVYYQSCPMAFESGEGFWLSAQKEIHNPYMGEMMAMCGETKEIVKK